MAKTISPGIYEMPSELYHADPCDTPSLSASIAHLLCSQSPAHAYAAHPRLNGDYKREEAERFDIGTVAHALLLEGEAAVEVVMASDWRTSVAKEARDAARAAGKQPLLADQYEEVVAMVEAASKQLERHNADPSPFTTGKPEQTLIWEEAGGVVCRARLDWLHNDSDFIDDYKTTSRTANPEQWSRSLFGAGCDVQAAFYLRGLKQVTGAEAEFRFVVQETSPPYALSVVSLTPAALMLAEKKVTYALARWRECLSRNSWPGYPTKVAYAELPGWEEERWLERELREEVAA